MESNKTPVILRRKPNSHTHTDLRNNNNSSSSSSVSQSNASPPAQPVLSPRLSSLSSSSLSTSSSTNVVPLSSSTAAVVPNVSSAAAAASNNYSVVPPLTNVPASLSHIDNALLSGLAFTKVRPFFLEVEMQIEEFLNDPNSKRKQFPPLSSYQRLVVHRTADYCTMDHIIAPNDKGERVVVLIKKPASNIPKLRFCDIVKILDEQAPQPATTSVPEVVTALQPRQIATRTPSSSAAVSTTDVPKVKIMKRQTNSKDNRGDAETASNLAEDHSKILQMKQEAYQKKRSEFFPSEVTADDEEDNDPPKSEQIEDLRAVTDAELYTRRSIVPTPRVYDDMYCVAPTAMYSTQYVDLSPSEIKGSNFLEIYDLPKGIPNYMADMLFEDLKEKGASIQWLPGGEIIAEFPSIESAQDVLESYNPSDFKLQWWFR